MNMSNALCVEKVHVWRGDRHVLQGVSAQIQPQELLHISGPNGTGKTVRVAVFTSGKNLELAKAAGADIVGLDVLDSTSPAATIAYINQFKRDVTKKHMPRIWGLHNYSETNRFEDSGTRAMLADVPGQVWLTETGGLAEFKPSFKFNLKRQEKATKYMFSLADSNSRIRRLYIYSWYGAAGKNGGFDAGLANAAGKPRAAYCVVFEHLRGKKSCPYKPVKN